MVEGQVLLVEDQVARRPADCSARSQIEGLEPAATPAEIRVSLAQRAPPAIQPGDRVRLRALLMPPSPPTEPFGFDFARQAFFSRLGAVGYALGKPERVARRRGIDLVASASRASARRSRARSGRRSRARPAQSGSR